MHKGVLTVSIENDLTLTALFVNLILSAFLATACDYGAKLSTHNKKAILAVSIAATIVAATQFIYFSRKATPTTQSLLRTHRTWFVTCSILLLVAFAFAGIKVLEAEHTFLGAFYCAVGVAINVSLLTFSAQHVAA